MDGFRNELDTLGSIEIDKNRLWGPNTERARRNFQISDFAIPYEFIRNLILIKKCYALAHREFDLIEKEKADLIVRACDELLAGDYESEFPLDVFQTGSGTSTNMNCNEVIAHLALKIAGRDLADKNFVHPNDHVNKSQSSNDVIPACIHLTCARLFHEFLMPAINNLHSQLQHLSNKYWNVFKLGRTHLQDALPIRVGQEIYGWVTQIELAMEQLSSNINELYELTLGGTAVGTGVNGSLEVSKMVVRLISEETGLPFRLARNFFAFQSSQDSVIAFAGALKRLAVALFKICNDLRHLSSGPKGGLGEYILPVVQAGSSIMPGKSNPVILESAIMGVSFVIGLETSVTMGGLNGNFQLNTSLPLIAFSMVHALKIMSRCIHNVTEKVLADLEIDQNRCLDLALKSPSLCTPLAKKLGYDKTAEVFKFSIKENITIPEAVRRMGLIGSVLTETELDELLNLENLT